MTSAISATDTVLDGLTAPGREPAARVVAPPGRIPAVRAEAQLQPFYRLSVDQYHRMAEAGILTSEDRVELLEGVLVEKMTKRERHLATTWLLHQALSRMVGPEWFVVVESPVVLSGSEPEPDLLVLRGKVPDYFEHRPGPGDVGLVIEVADTSYPADRARCALYAEAGLQEYWIVHLPARRIEVYADPTGPDPAPAYRQRRDYGIDEEIAVRLAGQEVGKLRVDSLLPPDARNNG